MFTTIANLESQDYPTYVKISFVGIRQLFIVCSNLSCVYVDIQSLKTKNCKYTTKAGKEISFRFSCHNHGVYDEARHQKVTPNTIYCNIPEGKMTSIITHLSRGVVDRYNIAGVLCPFDLCNRKRSWAKILPNANRWMKRPKIGKYQLNMVLS